MTPDPKRTLDIFETVAQHVAECHGMTLTHPRGDTRVRLTSSKGSVEFDPYGLKFVPMLRDFIKAVEPIIDWRI